MRAHCNTFAADYDIRCATRTVAGVHAQKIDQRLTQLVEQAAARRAQGLSPLDAQGVNKVMSVVFRPDGSISELSAIATMYSIDAPVYNMMGQQVDKSQKGIVIYKGRKYLNK